MKIVQTFWSGNQTAENYLHNKAGWLSAEYHWMSWALSSLQIRVFYDELELITDAIGKQFFEDVLVLPFTAVKAELDTLNKYDKRIWALAKIYAYSLQNEPFIHLDSDVFIWKSFDETLENAELIAQNLEIDFPFYYEPLQTMLNEFMNIPLCMKNEIYSNERVYSCNLGVAGGRDYQLFKEYKSIAFDIIDSNPQNLDKIDPSHLNICIEQFLFYAFAKSKEIQLKYLVEQEFDPTYPNYADFHDVPQQVTYIHAMAEYKRKPVVCHHLARRLRHDYPDYYYRIIDECLAAGLVLDWKCYPLSGLDETWRDLYEADKKQYRTIQSLFAEPLEDILKQKIVFNPICSLEEIETPAYHQILHYPDITILENKTMLLDSLNMLIIDSFLDNASINEAIETIKPYFDKEEITQNPALFRDLVLARTKELMFMGVLIVS